MESKDIIQVQNLAKIYVNKKEETEMKQAKG